MHLLGLLGSGHSAGPDRPDRLVRDDNPADGRGVEAGERPLDLRGHDRLGAARLPLLERLANAHDRHEAGGEGRLGLGVDDEVGLAGEHPPLRVTEDDVAAADVDEHLRRDLTGESAALLGVGVLASHGHVTAGRGHRRHDRHHIHRRRAEHEVDAGRLAPPAGHGGGKRHAAGMIKVHFPITGNDRSAGRRGHDGLLGCGDIVANPRPTLHSRADN